MQSRTLSAIEATLNILSGFLISLLVWVFLVPLVWPQHTSSASTSLGIVSLFTITSWLRSYGWRRFFETTVHKWLMRWRDPDICIVCHQPLFGSPMQGSQVQTDQGPMHFDCYRNQRLHRRPSQENPND